jgi:hypothetical protein
VKKRLGKENVNQLVSVHKTSLLRQYSLVIAYEYIYF